MRKPKLDHEKEKFYIMMIGAIGSLFLALAALILCSCVKEQIPEQMPIHNNDEHNRCLETKEVMDSYRQWCIVGDENIPICVTLRAYDQQCDKHADESR